MELPLRLVLPPMLLPAIGVTEKLFPRLARPRTLFVGSPCADEGTVGLLPDVDRQQVLSALQDALGRKMREIDAAMLVWKDFSQSGADDLDWVAERHGLFRMVSFPGALVELPAGKDAYFAALKPSRRYEIRRELRRSAERVEVERETIQRPDARTIDEIFALFWQTYERSATKFERLNRRFFSIVADMPVSHFIILREKRSGEMLAFMLCFHVGERVINKFIGIDYTRPKNWYLYFRLWDACLDWSLSRGATAIQSGQTGYAGKIGSGHRLVPLLNYGRHRNALAHAIARAVAPHIDWGTLDPDLATFLAAHPEAGAASK
jgi:hypothetical protein